MPVLRRSEDSVEDRDLSLESHTANSTRVNHTYKSETHGSR